MRITLALKKNNVEEIKESLLVEINNGELEVPLLPTVASEVLSSSLDYRANAPKLAVLIDKDQALASHILRVVNSPAFCGGAEIVSLKQSIARLGMERIREIALSVSLKGTLMKPGGFVDVVEDAWVFGLTTALWAKEITRSSRKNVEVAYLCGLLHNIGVPIVVARIVAQHLGVDHALVKQLSSELAPNAGAVLVEKWRLPNIAAVCIRSLCASPSEPGSGSDTDAVMVLKASRAIATQQLSGEIDSTALVEAEAFQRMNFYPDDVKALVAMSESIYEQVEGMK